MSSVVPHDTWGEPVDREEAARLIKMAMKRSRELQEKFEPGYFQPLDYGNITPTSEFNKRPPPARRYLFKGLLPAGIIGGLIAVGGTGKGHLNIIFGLCLATGKKIGPLEPARKFKVLYLAGEDSQEELHRRVHAAVQALWPDKSSPREIDNFLPVSVMGKLGPLMHLDRAGNPVNAPAYAWLCQTLENLPDLEVLILDPKVKFYGLDENNNTHCGAWINCLESLEARFKITILFSHHESKARAGTMDQASSRGGSALTDGCRWVANIKTMDSTTAQTFRVIDPHNYAVLDITKNNYAAKLPAPIYFRRVAGGALIYVDLTTERVRVIADQILDRLSKEEADGRHFSRRDLLYDKKAKPVIDEIKEVVPGFNRIRDITHAVDYLLDAGWLKEEKVREAKTGPEKTILRVIATTG